MNIEHVGVYANDTEVLSIWYKHTLGMRETHRIEKAGRPPVVFLQGETGAIVEFLPTSELKRERALNCPGYSHLGIVVENIDQEIGRLAGLGVDVKGVRSTSNGWTIGYFDDPEGNTLELIQRS